MVGYIFGGNTGIKNPEELARARALAEALLGPQRPAQNVGEGLAVLGQAIRGRREMNAANAASTAGSDSAQSAIAKALGGAGAFPAAPTLGSASAAAAPPSGANADAIRQGLVSRGMNPQVADAFVMNYQDESGLNPGINEKNPTVAGSRGGFGLAQWTGPRRDALEAFAAQQGKPASDLDTQLDFTMHELGGPEASAYKAIQAAPDTGHAAAAIVNQFLRPRDDLRAARESRYLKSSGPVQVASNDPSAGVAQALGQPAPNPVAAALSLPQQAPVPQGRPSIASALNQQPQPGVDAGAPAAASPAGQRVVQQMVNPQPMSGGAPLPMMGMPPQAQAAPPQQVAQNQPNLDQIPVIAGGNAGAIQKGQMPSIQQLMEASQNPWLNDEQRGLVNMLMKRQMDQSDPNNQLDAEYKRAQISALNAKQDALPDSVKALKERAAAAGLVEGTQEFKNFMVTGGHGPQTVINTGDNSSVFAKKSDENAAKRLDDIVQSGQTAPQTMADMQQLLDLGSQIGTGKEAQVKALLGPYAQSLGIDINGLPEIQAYQAITSRLAPQMRAVGSGSSSDTDVAMFMQSLPNLKNTPQGNELIANTMKSVAQNKVNAAAIARKAQRGDITWQDADEQISKLPNPYDLFKQFQKDTQKKTVIDGYTIEEVP